MRISLVSMPWHALDRPSLALGILRRLTDRCRDRHQVNDYYGNLRWAEFLLEQTQGRITPLDYLSVSDVGIFLGMGDWIFTGALYDVAAWRLAEYQQFLTERGVSPGLALAMQTHANAFVQLAADEVLAQSPDIVGFTTTFMQNVPSLALARELKRRRPGLTTIFGGANCEGPMGAAMHRNFPDIDLVVRGEGERAFVEVLDALSAGRQPEEVAGVCWRDGGGVSRANPEQVQPCPMHLVPTPDYDAYFDRLATSSLRPHLDPKIVVEAARGCWWGEKHQCTFCGLNGATMKFRSKPAERVWSEISTAVERYQSLDVIMVDNIIDMGYFKSLLPTVASSDWDLKIHYEVKSNLTSEHVRALRQAHVYHIQPGIESLNSRVLKLMRKGVSGPQNVQLLRDAEEQGLTVSWNYLYGFPGEDAPDYENVIQQIAALSHLQPPFSAARIALERFSPNFDDPTIGFVERRPADFYRFVYALPPEELADLVYLFDTPDRGIGADLENRLQLAIAEWRNVYPRSSLTYQLEENRLIVHDRRAGFPPSDCVFDEPEQVAAFLALRRNTTIRGLKAALDEVGQVVTMEQLSRFVHTLKGRGLVYEDSGFFVALALGHDPTRSRIIM